MFENLAVSLMTAQGLLLGLKLTGQITWPWLSVFSPIVILGSVSILSLILLLLLSNLYAMSTK
jgi:hypothetical protein